MDSFPFHYPESKKSQSHFKLVAKLCHSFTKEKTKFHTHVTIKLKHSNANISHFFFGRCGSLNENAPLVHILVWFVTMKWNYLKELKELGGVALWNDLYHWGGCWGFKGPCQAYSLSLCQWLKDVGLSYCPSACLHIAMPLALMTIDKTS